MRVISRTPPTTCIRRPAGACSKSDNSFAEASSRLHSAYPIMHPCPDVTPTAVNRSTSRGNPELVLKLEKKSSQHFATMMRDDAHFQKTSPWNDRMTHSDWEWFNDAGVPPATRPASPPCCRKNASAQSYLLASSHGRFWTIALEALKVSANEKSNLEIARPPPPRNPTMSPSKRRRPTSLVTRSNYSRASPLRLWGSSTSH